MVSWFETTLARPSPWRTQPSNRRLRAPKQRQIGARDGLALAVLSDPVERLRQALQREGVGGLGAFGGNALDHEISGPAHGLDHALLLGRILDPEPVALGVHRVSRAAD